MMDFFKIVSRILLIPPVITLSYDLIYGWFVKNHLLIRPLRLWWVDMSPNTIGPFKDFASSMTSLKFVSSVMDTPAPFVLIVPALFFYVLYRLIFLLQGGKTGGGGGMVYKSRH